MKRNVLVALAAALGSLCLASGPHAHRSKDHHRVVFDKFPSEASLLRQDLRPVVDQIIREHGELEWETVVLTSEFHTHLGIYSVIGAKMGLKAREHFGVGLDRLVVKSFAGRKPPVSCLTDGIQVSTGATLGHGTISVAENAVPAPRAHFFLGDTGICLALKEAYWRQVQGDIGGIIRRHGALTDKYWAAVRQLGIKYWAQWSRDDLFDLTLVKRP
jgi:pyrimidine-specific ribonucleoside hydrolase